MDRLTTIKAAASAAAAALTAFWGWTGWLAAAWFLAMVLDYATGSARFIATGHEHLAGHIHGGLHVQQDFGHQTAGVGDFGVGHIGVGDGNGARWRGGRFADIGHCRHGHGAPVIEHVHRAPQPSLI